MTKEELRSILFQGMGYASMCWEPKPKGVFDSTSATSVSEEVYKAIEEYAKEVAIGFAGWMGQNNVKEASSFGDVWYIGIFYEKTYTTEQLFNQYLQHLNQSKI